MLGGVHAAKGFTEQVLTSAEDNFPWRAELLALFACLQLPAECNCGAVGIRNSRGV